MIEIPERTFFMITLFIGFVMGYQICFAIMIIASSIQKRAAKNK